MRSHPEAPGSGRFLLRMSPALHDTLRSAARAAGLSLNEYCVRRLVTGSVVHDDAAALVSRAAAVVGDALAAVVLHGSWVRGDAASGSDVDAVIVVDRTVPLRRSLYREWDRRPVTWSHRPVDPHFVHLPVDTGWSGLWAEIATHGLTVLDRDGDLGAHLARVRGAIADGRLRRRTAHGQPYWTEAAVS